MLPNAMIKDDFAGNMLHTVDFPAQIILQPETTYFAVFTAPDAPTTAGQTSAYQIRLATTMTTASAGWSIADDIRSIRNATPPWLISSNRLAFGISAEPRPEFVQGVGTTNHLGANTLLIGFSTFNLARSQAFTTGANTDGYDLTQVSFHLRNTESTPGQLQVAIHEEDNDGNPGAMLPNAMIKDDFAGNMLHTVDFPAQIILQPETTYFAVFTAPDAPTTTGQTSAYQIRLATTMTTASAGWSIADNIRSIRDATPPWLISVNRLAFGITATPLAIPALSDFAAAATDLDVVLSWDVDNVGSPISGYTLTRALGTATAVPLTAPAIGVTTFTDTVTAPGEYTYTLIATNGIGDSMTATVAITVNPLAPIITASVPTLIATAGTAIAPVTIDSTGGAVASYSISPDIANGLTFDANSGTISGTPAAVASEVSYTITATNAADTATDTVAITVNPPAPIITASVPTLIATAGTAIAPVTIDSTGGAVASYSISPDIANGLTFSTSSGTISGTPTAVAAAQDYTITATNAADTATATVAITVDAAVPTLTNFAAVLTGFEVALSWDVNDGGSAITVYALTRTFGSNTAVTITPPPATGATTFTDTVPAAGVYTYTLMAINLIGPSTAVMVTARGGSEEQVAAVVSEVARALMSSTVSAVTSRISNVASGLAGAQVGGLNLNDAIMASALTTHAQAFAGNSDAMKTLLGNSDFSLPLNAAGDGDGDGSGGGSVAVWASGEYSDLSGESDDLDWDGELTGFHIGIDSKIRTSGDKNILIGVALSSLNGDLDYEDETTAGSTEKGNYEIGMTTISQYIGWRAGVVDLWASVGFGEGELTRNPETSAKSTSDTQQTSFAIGGSGVVRTKESYNLRVKGELSASQFDIKDSDNSSPAIAKATLDATRARLSIEARNVRHLENGRAFEKSAEIGARFDGGDGETGSGVEIGGQLRYANSLIGFTVEGSARVLLGHSGDYEEWGIQGTIRKQVGRDGQGLAFHLTPAYGDVNSGVAELLAQGLNDDVADNTADPDYHMNLTTRLGYGIAYRGMVTSYTEMVLGTTNQYRMGVNWKPNQTFNLTLLGEQTKQNVDTKNSIQLQGTINF